MRELYQHLFSMDPQTGVRRGRKGRTPAGAGSCEITEKEKEQVVLSQGINQPGCWYGDCCDPKLCWKASIFLTSQNLIPLPPSQSTLCLPPANLSRCTFFSEGSFFHVGKLLVSGWLQWPWSQDFLGLLEGCRVLP